MQKPILREGNKFLKKLIRKAKSIFTGLKKGRCCIIHNSKEGSSYEFENDGWKSNKTDILFCVLFVTCLKSMVLHW